MYSCYNHRLKEGKGGDRIMEEHVLKAKEIVESFLRNNGVANIYTTTNQNTYGIYINWTSKSITIHGPNSNAWLNAMKNPNQNNIFNKTDNGLWIGPFSSFTVAFTFAELLKRVLYINTMKGVALASGNGIKHNPMKIF